MPQTTTTPRSSRELLRDPNLRLILGITLMVVMGVASITPAFPRIRQALNLHPAELSLLITAFTLPGMILTPFLGVLADRVGRKLVLVPSLLLFGAAGALCGFFSDFHILLGLRTLQGMGAASLGVLNMTILSDRFEGRERAQAMGIRTSFQSLAVASYPLLGGALANLDWHYPFFLPALAVPLGLAVLVWMEAGAPDTTQDLGEYLRSTGRAMRDRRVAGCFLGVFSTFTVLYGPYLTFTPLRLGEDFGAPPFIIGVVMSSFALTTAVTSAQSGRLTERFGEPLLMRTAFVLYAVSVASMAVLPGTWWFLFAALTLGLGQGIGFPSLQKLLADLAPPAQRGAFMAVNGWFLRMAQTISPMLMAALYAFIGMDGMYAASAAFCLAVAFATMRLMR